MRVVEVDEAGYVARVGDAAARPAPGAFGGRAEDLGGRHAVEDYPPEAFEAVMRINLMGTVHCCAALVPGMKVWRTLDAVGWPPGFAVRVALNSSGRVG